MGVINLSKVRQAARLAVYVDIIISVKNHQPLARIRPDRDLKRKPYLCYSGVAPKRLA
jgi:hypothetical protein